MKSFIDRRTFLKGSLALGAAGVLGLRIPAGAALATSPLIRPPWLQAATKRSIHVLVETETAPQVKVEYGPTQELGLTAQVKGVEETKKDLDQTKAKFYAGAEYFTQLERTRFSFGLNLNFVNFSLMTRVKEEPDEGKPRFTALLGKNYSFITFGAGLLDSGLGAAAYLNFFNQRLKLGIEASKFYDKSYPFLRHIPLALI